MTDPSNFVNQHADRWTIPESMVEYEKKIAALEQRVRELKEVNERLNKLLTELMTVKDKDLAKLKADNALLRKRLDSPESNGK